MPAAPSADIIQIDRTLQIPTISIEIGQAQFGSYVFGLWNRHGRAFLIGSGDTDDEAPTSGAEASFRIVRTRDQLVQLDGFQISIAVFIQNFRVGQGARWSCNWELAQGDILLDEESRSQAATQRTQTIEKRYQIDLV